MVYPFQTRFSTVECWACVQDLDRHAPSLVPDIPGVASNDHSEDIPQGAVNALEKLREGPGPQGGLFHNFFSPHYSSKRMALQ